MLCRCAALGSGTSKPCIRERSGAGIGAMALAVITQLMALASSCRSGKASSQKRAALCGSSRRYSALMGGYRHSVVLRSEEHTSELQSLMRISYAVFCLKKKQTKTKTTQVIILN